MRYLFFDIECCDGQTMCEFGYVITDTQFNIIEKVDITINPDRPFNNFERMDRDPNFRLSYPESVYRKSYKFPYFYERIKSLICEPDQIIVGHAINNDAIFLNNACRRYGLEPISFKFADTQKMYSDYYNINKCISLENAGDSFKVEKPKYLHKSDDDSFLTMKLVEAMANSLECSLDELIYLCDNCTGLNDNGSVSYNNTIDNLDEKYKKLLSDTDNYIQGYKMTLFRSFLINVKPQGEIIKSKLNDKKISVSINYEREHFKEILCLIQLIVNHGGKYTLKASNGDMFVSYEEIDNDGNIRNCNRLKYVNEAMKEGKKIEIISFKELLMILNINEDYLSNSTYPDKSYFKRDRVNRSCNGGRSRKRKSLNYSESDGGFSIGELTRITITNT